MRRVNVDRMRRYRQRTNRGARLWRVRRVLNGSAFEVEPWQEGMVVAIFDDAIDWKALGRIVPPPV